MTLSFTAQIVLLGAGLLGVVGGALGCFALLRRQSLLGDALAHAALPGVCIGYLVSGTKSPTSLFIGALVAGLIGSMVILAIERWSRVKEDTAIGIVLSVFFGLGIVLLTYIQKLPNGNQSGLDHFLFGQAAALMPRDIKVMAVLGGLVLASIVLFHKELKLLTFDRDFGDSLGVPMRRLEIFLTLLLVIVVVVGLRTVGVILMVATLITPAAAARQWTERLGVMMLLAALIGGGSGAAGALLSAHVARLPTGPVIVLCSSAILVLSLLVAPQRGLVWSGLRQLNMIRRIRRENLLKDLYAWGERRDHNWSRPVPWSVLMGVRGQSGGQIGRTARQLRRRGLLTERPRGPVLTEEGLADAALVVRKHRLWETYLTRALELPPDHVHRDADAMEHALDEQALNELDAQLDFPAVDPHGQPIPRPVPHPIDTDRAA